MRKPLIAGAGGRCLQRLKGSGTRGDVDLWDIERGLAESGYCVVCGIDEAGRGPLAGPVYAAAVVLPMKMEIPGLDDSKKLNADVRETLFGIIKGKAVAFGIASADNREIDELNILQATFLAMNRALKKISPVPDIILVDGNRNPMPGLNVRCIIGGDGLSASIAAASILAKVSRDRYMTEISKIYPQYAFEKHKGYGTKLHYEMLREHGPCEMHRTTFLRAMKHSV